MDTVDKTTRSRIMSRVGQKDTGPEMKLRRSLHKIGLRYRLHDKRLPGSPDIVFPRFKAVLFVHGCFWHRHGCKATTTPGTNVDFEAIGVTSQHSTSSQLALFVFVNSYR